MNIALWVLQILFAALFMLHAVLHLFPSPRLKGILALAVVMVGATVFHVSRKETLATVAAASLALIMIFLACGRTFVVPLH